MRVHHYTMSKYHGMIARPYNTAMSPAAPDSRVGVRASCPAAAFSPGLMRAATLPAGVALCRASVPAGVALVVPRLPTPPPTEAEAADTAAAAAATAVWVSLEPDTGVSEILYPSMTVSVGQCWAQVGAGFRLRISSH